MTDFTRTAAGWGLHTAAAGVIVFGLGWAWVRLVADPARRQKLGGWVVRGGLVAAVLCLFPAWLLLPVPRWAEAERIESTLPLAERPARSVDLPVPRSEPRDGLRPQVPAPSEPPGDSAVAVVAEPEEPAEVELPPSLASPGIGESDLHAVPGPSALAMRDHGVAPEPLLARTSAVAPAQPESPWPDTLRLLLAVYGVGVLFAAGSLALGMIALARLRRSSEPADAAIQSVFDAISGETGYTARLLVSDRLGSPVCFGLFYPTVVLPRGLAATATECELRWVFAHELNHLVRGDPWTAWWIGLAQVVFFFVPWFWQLRRDLGRTQEYLADAAAAADGRAEDYAAFLIRLSCGPGGRRHPAAAAAVRAGRSDLFRRVSMLLMSKGQVATRASRRWAVGVAGCVLGVAAVLAGIGFGGRGAAADEPRARDQDRSKDSAKGDARPDARPEKKPPQFDPKDVRVGAPPELAALRAAVEDAAKRGEDVDEIRKQLASLERALAGKPWARPQPAPEPPLPGAGRGDRGDLRPRGGFGGGGGFGGFGGGGGAFVFPVQPDMRFPFAFPAGPNPEDVQKMAELIRKATELRLKNPRDPEVEKLLAEARELMQKGMFRPNVIAGGFGNPGLAGFGRGDVRDRAVSDSRLGVRLEAVPAVLAEQLGLPRGQGLVVVSVLAVGSAEKAGVKPNDLLLEFAGKPVPGNPAEFRRAVRTMKAGEKVDLVVLRKGKRETIKGVELPEAPRGDADARGDFARPGFNVVPNPFDQRRPERDPGARPAPEGGRRVSNSVQVQVQDGRFTLKAEQNGVKYDVDGTIGEDGKPAPSKILITGADGKTIANETNLDKVPAEHRDRVKRLLGGIGGSNIRERR